MRSSDRRRIRSRSGHARRSRGTSRHSVYGQLFRGNLAPPTSSARLPCGDLPDGGSRGPGACYYRRAIGCRYDTCEHSSRRLPSALDSLQIAHPPRYHPLVLATGTAEIDAATHNHPGDDRSFGTRCAAIQTGRECFHHVGISSSMRPRGRLRRRGGIIAPMKLAISPGAKCTDMDCWPIHARTVTRCKMPLYVRSITTPSLALSGVPMWGVMPLPVSQNHPA